MQWLIVRSVTGEKFLAEVEGNIAECVKNRTPVMFKNLLEIQTVNVSTQGGMVRMTKLSEIDFCIGEEEVTPLPQMHMLVAAWYKPDEELVKEMMEDIHESKKASVEMRNQAESNLSQVRAMPMPQQGMPGFPGMGGFVPPGRR
jgi:hypothetical protein